eukprot:Skav232414  [mRNA]  locus=scaffold189:560:6393:+ [translate_table: standard]
MLKLSLQDSGEKVGEATTDPEFEGEENVVEPERSGEPLSAEEEPLSAEPLSAQELDFANEERPVQTVYAAVAVGLKMVGRDAFFRAGEAFGIRDSGEKVGEATADPEFEGEENVVEPERSGEPLSAEEEPLSAEPLSAQELDFANEERPVQQGESDAADSNDASTEVAADITGEVEGNGLDEPVPLDGSAVTAASGRGADGSSPGKDIEISKDNREAEGKMSADPGSIQDSSSSSTPEVLSSTSSFRSSGTAGERTDSQDLTTQKPADADREAMSSQSSLPSPAAPDSVSQTIATKKPADTANMYNANGNQAALLTSTSSLGSTGTSPGDGTASKSFLAQKPTGDPDNMVTDNDDKGQDLGSQSSLRSNEAAAIGEDTISKSIPTKKSVDTANMYNVNGNQAALLTSNSSLGSTGTSPGERTVSQDLTTQKPTDADGEAMSSQSSLRSPEAPDGVSQTIATKKPADTANVYNANGNQAALLTSTSSLGSTETSPGDGTASKSFLAQKPTDDPDNMDTDIDDKGQDLGSQSSLRSNEAAAIGEDTISKSIPTKKSVDTANMYNVNGNQAALLTSNSSLGSTGTSPGERTVSQDLTTQKPTDADGEAMSSQSSLPSPAAPDSVSQTIATKKPADTANVYNANGNQAALLTSTSSLGSTETSAGDGTASKSFLAQKPTDDPDNMDR